MQEFLEIFCSYSQVFWEKIQKNFWICTTYFPLSYLQALGESGHANLWTFFLDPLRLVDLLEEMSAPYSSLELGRQARRKYSVRQGLLQFGL
jgi:hypothetical protein